MTTDNLSFYPITDKEYVPTRLSVLQEIEIEQNLAHDLNHYYYAQVTTHALTFISFVCLACFFFLNTTKELLAFSLGAATLFLFTSFCITHLYHEAIKNQQRYEELIKRLNIHSRSQ